MNQQSDQGLVSHLQVKQIAGRAGRRNSSHPEGLATTFLPDDLPKLREAMAAPMETANKGGLFPIFEQMELFAGQLPEVSFPDLLDK
jgi:ATP-dependent RNA helicase SUPV3L1/SUV3